MEHNPFPDKRKNRKVAGKPEIPAGTSIYRGPRNHNCGTEPVERQSLQPWRNQYEPGNHDGTKLQSCLGKMMEQNAERPGGQTPTLSGSRRSQEEPGTEYTYSNYIIYIYIYVVTTRNSLPIPISRLMKQKPHAVPVRNARRHQNITHGRAWKRQARKEAPSELMESRKARAWKSQLPSPCTFTTRKSFSHRSSPKSILYDYSLATMLSCSYSATFFGGMVLCGTGLTLPTQAQLEPDSPRQSSQANANAAKLPNTANRNLSILEKLEYLRPFENWQVSILESVEWFTGFTHWKASENKNPSKCSVVWQLGSFCIGLWACPGEFVGPS